MDLTYRSGNSVWYIEFPGMFRRGWRGIIVDKIHSGLPRAAYVILSLFLASLGFVKSYLLMRLITVSELGLISILQSIIMVVGFSQIGIINGSFRIISKSESHLFRFNSMIFSYFLYISLLLNTLLIPAYYFFEFKVPATYMFFSVAAGILTILSNWMNSLLIAQQKLKLLNWLSFFSVVFSLSFVILIRQNNMWPAILVATSQPIIFLLLAVKFNKITFKIGPLDLRAIKYALKAGFIPYALGIIYYVFTVFEKWIMGADLGLTGVGEYYLVNIYTLFFLIIPSALNNLLFPQLMKSSNKKTTHFQLLKSLKTHFLVSVLYCVIVGLLTFFVLEDLIRTFIPAYIGSYGLIEIIYVGMVMLTLVQPVIIIMSIKVEYRKMIISYISALFAVLIAYTLFTFKKDTTLSTYAWSNTFFNSVLVMGLIISFFRTALTPSTVK